jgi:hypothetical protein
VGKLREERRKAERQKGRDKEESQEQREMRNEKREKRNVNAYPIVLRGGLIGHGFL